MQMKQARCLEKAGAVDASICWQVLFWLYLSVAGFRDDNGIGAPACLPSAKQHLLMIEMVAFGPRFEVSSVIGFLCYFISPKL